MESAGWVERRTHPADRRAVQLYLTAQSQPILEEMHARAADTLTEATRGVAPRAQRQLVATLEQMKRNLLAAEVTAAVCKASAGADGRKCLRDHMVGRAAKVGHVARRVLRSGICLGVLACVGFAASAARSEGLPDALAKAYQSNPTLNAERARQRAHARDASDLGAGDAPHQPAPYSSRLGAKKKARTDAC